MASRRRPWIWLIGFAIVGILLGAMAAAVARDRASHAGEPTARPAVVLTPAAPTEATRSLAPPTVTSELSPEPSAKPTAETGAAGSSRTSLAAFVKHVSAATKAGEALLEPLQQAAEALDIKATKRAASAISDWAETERSWLDRHPPRACYAAVHAEYGSGVDDFGQAAKITKRFADAFPFADFDDLQRAMDRANAGATSMQEASDLLKSVSC